MQSYLCFDFPEKLKFFLLTPVTSECMFCLLLGSTNFIDRFCIKLHGKFADEVIITVNCISEACPEFFLPDNTNDAI